MRHINNSKRHPTKKYIILQDKGNICAEIYYEICNITHEKSKDFVIIGSGDSAFDYALNLSKNNKVTIINRTDIVKCLPVLWDRAQKNENISYIRNTLIKAASKEKEKIVLTLESTVIRSQKTIKTDYLIAAIGRDPNLEFISKDFENKINDLMDKDLLFMAGDVKNNIYRQTAIKRG
ncbi:MAG: NAD(P)-binding domain-containing protein [Desulfobacterales bacterium]|nr:NAD(P)-binding domain-containing protein [Desulfobacterales bacterium]